MSSRRTRSRAARGIDLAHVLSLGAVMLALSLCGVVLGVGDAQDPSAPDNALAPSLWAVGQSALLVLLAYQVFRFRSKPMRWLAITVSIAASLRYITWRATHTLSFGTNTEAICSIVLLLAELYGVLMMMAGHFQTFAPTNREVPPVPEGAELPTVDVYVTTYNEDVEIVRRTAVGAAAIDYARKRVWILDDGKRETMRALAGEIGVGYITRDDNAHAKAGNLNAALKVTSGELILQLDADHVPVRSFLDETVPFFLHDLKLAFVQTPQRFYNPDPFQRNLFVGDHLANEQDLFFRVVQPGNDRWNAAFFCGSSAVLRRSALEDVGGFATETVTEDAHTALRLHAAGWNSAYYNRCLAAGLSAESFGDALAQRMRWGMGMLSMLRVDPPLFIRGLRVPQRICYTAAGLFFLFGLPRLVFFLAPVAFLLFGLQTLDASVSHVLAYFVPHMLAGLFVYAAVSRNIRHSFWSEVFEASLAVPMAIAATWALFTRRRLPFVVTPKGQRMDKARLNWRAALGPGVLLALSLAGIAVAAFGATQSDRGLGVGRLNALWCAYNVLVLAAATLACCDRPQKRSEPRIPCHTPVHLRWLENGRFVRFSAWSLDLSEGGLRVLCDVAPPTHCGIEVEIARGKDRVCIDARVAFCDHSAQDDMFVCGLRGTPRSTADRHALIRMMFCDPRTWDSPPVSEALHRSLWRFALSSLRWAKTREQPILRRAPRVLGDWSAILSTDESERVVRVVDLSEGGAGIRGRRLALTSGEHVVLRVSTESDAVVTLDARIAHVDGDSAGLTFDALGAAQRTKLRWLLHTDHPSGAQLRRAG